MCHGQCSCRSTWRSIATKLCPVFFVESALSLRSSSRQAPPVAQACSAVIADVEMATRHGGVGAGARARRMDVRLLLPFPCTAPSLSLFLSFRRVRNTGSFDLALRNRLRRRLARALAWRLARMGFFSCGAEGVLLGSSNKTHLRRRAMSVQRSLGSPCRRPRMRGSLTRPTAGARRRGLVEAQRILAAAPGALAHEILQIVRAWVVGLVRWVSPAPFQVIVVKGCPAVRRTRMSCFINFLRSCSLERATRRGEAWRLTGRRSVLRKAHVGHP